MSAAADRNENPDSYESRDFLRLGMDGEVFSQKCGGSQRPQARRSAWAQSGKHAGKSGRGKIRMPRKNSTAGWLRIRLPTIAAGSCRIRRRGDRYR